MTRNPNSRIAILALLIFALDQIAKLIVIKLLGFGEERVVVDGFFKFVHWGNTGAAWSMFYGNNTGLAAVAVVSLVVLILIRRHFELHRIGGQIALGLIMGGILGNLADRIIRKHVTDFIYFYVIRRNGDEAGFPAFNLADSAICIGVGLLFVLSWQGEEARSAQPKPGASASE